MNNRKKIIAIVALVLILILAGVSAFVAYRISTQQGVAPNAPQSQPAASVTCSGAGGACQAANLTCASPISNTTGCTTGEICCKKTTTTAANWVGSNACTTTFTINAPACTVRPACLDATTPCKQTEPTGGWCPYLACSAKTMYKNDSRNTAGKYYLTTKISNGGSVYPGDILVFSVPYKNSTSTTITSATVTDTLDSRFTFMDADSGCSYASGKVTCKIGQVVAGGTSQKSYRVKVKTTAATGKLTNTANIAAISSKSTSASLSQCHANLTIAVAPTVSLACTSETAMNSDGTSVIETVGKSQTVTYSMDIKNGGNSAASNVVVTNTLSDSLSFVDSSSCTFASASRTVTCNISSLAAGATKTLTFRAKTSSGLTDGQVITNTSTAKLSSSTSTETGSQCASSLTVALASLSASKQAYNDNTNNAAGDYQLTDAISSVAKNQTFVYAIQINNGGTGTASGVNVTDPLTGSNQDQLTFTDEDSRCNYDETSKTVKCTVDVQPSSSETVAFRVTVSDGAVNGTTISNTGTVSYGGTDLSVTKDLTVSTVVACNNTCTTDAECQSGLTCDTSTNKCRDSACSTEESCVCPATITETPTAAPTTTIAETTITPTTTVTVAESTTTPTTTTVAQTAETLPSTGAFDLPGATIFGGGLVLAILGILLAL